MNAVSAHYVELEAAIRTARAEAQLVIANTPCYAPDPWQRELEHLLGTALLMAEAGRIAYETWLVKQITKGSE